MKPQADKPDDDPTTSHAGTVGEVGPVEGDPMAVGLDAGLVAGFAGLSDSETRAAFSSLAAEASGSWIAGKYKLLQPLGEGGMGSVWVAEQREPVRRRVAVKLIRVGRDSRAMLARFDAERQALAVMDHPNIARVFDGGLTEAGRPFFVMELVKGVSITTYCDQTQLSIRERLELFTQVCSAVQHAHQKGIIHRDLKPSNVMVTEVDARPVCKVIDFGLAKAISGTQVLTDLTLDTAFGSILGTPLYMAPEQLGVSALDIDTRADLYSLGVLLYELLTGTTPIERDRLQNAAWEEIRRILRDEDPPTPSLRLSTVAALPSIAARRHVEPAKLKSMIRGELDWIIMKALEKERSRRYETASAFALDVQRYLVGESVQAAPPSRFYRLRKLVRRHRGAFLIAALLFVSLAIGLLGTSLGLRFAYLATLAERQAKQAAIHEKELAEQQRVQAVLSQQQTMRAISRFGDVIAANPGLMNDPKLADLRTELLAEPLDFFRERSRQLEAEAQTEGSALLQWVTSIRQVARLTAEIGDNQQALAGHLEALELLERFLEKFPQNSILLGEVANSANDAGLILRDQGREGEALKLFERARDIYQAFYRKESTPQNLLSLARVQVNRDSILLISGDDPAAKQESVQVIQWLESLHPMTPEQIEIYAGALSGHVGLERRQGQIQAAIDLQQRVVELRRRLVATSNGHPQVECDLAEGLRRLGNLNSQNQDWENALAFYEQSRDVARASLGRHPSHLKLSRELAACLTDLVQHYNELERRTESIAAGTEALPIWQRLTSGNPTVLDFKFGLANVLNRMGAFELTSAAGSQGRDYFEQSEKVLAEILGELPSLQGRPAEMARESLSAAHFNLGQFFESIIPVQCRNHHYQALRLREENAAANPANPQLRANLAVSLNTIALLELSRSDHVTAKAMFDRADEILKTLIRDFPDEVFFRLELASCAHRRAGGLLLHVDSSAAVTAYRQAVSAYDWLVEKTPHAGHLLTDLGGALNDWAMVEIEGGEFAAALQKIDRAIECQKSALNQRPDSKVARRYLANHYFNLKRVAVALADAELGRRARREQALLMSTDLRFAEQDQALQDYRVENFALTIDERVTLGRRAFETGNYLLAVTLYEPVLSDAQLPNRDRPRVVADAVLAAVLAAQGEGNERFVGALETSGLLAKAAAWALADLTYWENALIEISPEGLPVLQKNMNNWQRLPEVACLADPVFRENLPPAERLAWEEFWKKLSEFQAVLERKAQTK
jgi:eukaryotic-like serine/threonine-protein kinase